MFFLQSLWIAFLVVCVGIIFTLLSGTMTIMSGYHKDIDLDKDKTEDE